MSRLDRAHGRFVPLDGGRFVALTAGFARQLRRLEGVSEETAGGRRLHGLASMAVDDLVESAGKVQADKHWRELSARIRAAGSHTPQGARHVAGGAARLSGRRLHLDVAARQSADGRLPRRRHGPRQDGADHRGDAGAAGQWRVPRRGANLRLPQLGKRAGAFRTDAERVPSGQRADRAAHDRARWGRATC